MPCHTVIFTCDKPHYPFEIPSNWIWVTLGEISFSCLGKMLDKEKNKGNCKPYLRNINVRWGSFDTSDLLLMPFEDNEIDRYTIKKGDLVVCEGGEPGRCAIWKNNDTIMFQKALHRIRFFNGVVTEYIAKAFELFSLNSTIEQYFTGSTIKHLTGASLDTILLPLPPEKEQIRIIQYINGLEAIVAEIENNCCKMSRFTSQVKSKILELAINGKLVPQDHADEPAEVLLKRVNPNAVVSADTSHYQHLPQGWCACRLEDIVDYEQPQRYIVESTSYNDTYKTPVLTAGKSFIIGYTNETAGIFNNLPVIIFDDFTTDSKYVDFPFKVKSSAMKIIHVKNGVNVKYVYYFMSITRLVGKTHKRYWISEYSKLNIPLPPYNEQCRIVEAIENINRRIDDIAEAL